MVCLENTTLLHILCVHHLLHQVWWMLHALDLEPEMWGPCTTCLIAIMYWSVHDSSVSGGGWLRIPHVRKKKVQVNNVCWWELQFCLNNGAALDGSRNVV